MAAIQLDVKLALLLCAHGFLFSYVLTLLLAILKNPVLSRLISIILIILLTALLFTDIVCYHEYHSFFSGNFLSALFGTDPSESKEFVELHYRGFILAFICILSIFIIYWFSRNRTTEISSQIASLLLLLIFPCLFILNIKEEARKVIIMERSPEGKLIKVVNELKAIPPDSEHFHVPITISQLHNHPSNIILIIGESHCKSHCQFYGYDKNTMPHLQEWIDQGDIIMFRDAIAPTITTSEVFRSLMTTYKQDMGKTIKYYRCPNIPEIMHAAGYRTIWISNQARRGLFDNVAGNFSALCDTMYYVGGIHKDAQVNNYDSEVLPLLQKDMLDTTAVSHFYTIHLMGSHPKFSERYPKEYGVFSPSQYHDRPEHQRKNYATYDNSLIFTDTIIDSIIKEFVNKEAIIIYLSDHALDFYESGDDYCAHAVISNPLSVEFARRIPMFIYVTELFRSNYPNICNDLEKQSFLPYYTEDLIYTLTSIAGVTFASKAE